MLPIERTIAQFVRNAPFSTAGPEDRVAVAVAAMLEKKVDSVLVAEDGKPIGIFTEHDFLTRVASQRRDPATTPNELDRYSKQLGSSSALEKEGIRRGINCRCSAGLSR